MAGEILFDDKVKWGKKEIRIVGIKGEREIEELMAEFYIELYKIVKRNELKKQEELKEQEDFERRRLKNE